jgi:hypothetical protein
MAHLPLLVEAILADAADFPISGLAIAEAAEGDGLGMIALHRMSLWAMPGQPSELRSCHE